MLSGGGAPRGRGNGISCATAELNTNTPTQIIIAASERRIVFTSWKLRKMVVLIRLIIRGSTVNGNKSRALTSASRSSVPVLVSAFWKDGQLVPAIPQHLYEE